MLLGPALHGALLHFGQNKQVALKYNLSKEKTDETVGFMEGQKENRKEKSPSGCIPRAKIQARLLQSYLFCGRLIAVYAGYWLNSLFFIFD